jgi:peptide deformylase
MSELKLVTVPDPILRLKCDKVPTVLQASEIGKQMLRLMEDSHGVGLAAPQVGLQYKIFVASETAKAKDGIIFYDPRILSTHEGMILAEEGCLSIPGIRLPILRHKAITVAWRDPASGQEKTKRLSGLMARVFQHEYDHLMGVLISDRFQEQANNSASEPWNDDPLADLCR